MKEFLNTWVLGYYYPYRFIENLKDKPAPQWGLAAQILRGLLDAIALYLPLALLGRQPSFPSWFTIIPTKYYYFGEIVIAPVFLICQWLLICTSIHICLRLLRRQSDIDQILNISGMTALVVGTFLIVWDWVFISIGVGDYIILGISHLLIDIWAIILTVIGFKNILNIPIKLGILLNIIWLILGLLLAMIFMRAPN